MNSRCRDCGAQIRWAVTTNGIRMRFDVLPDPQGEWLLNYEAARRVGERIRPGGWTALWVSQPFRAEAELHADHRDNCAVKTKERCA